MHQAPRKYGCLRAIGYVILIAAWIVLILGVGGAVVSWLTGARMFSGIQLGIIQVLSGLSLLLSLALFFQWFVLGSVLTLMTDLERNTRRNATAVDHLVALAEAPEKTVVTLPPVAMAAGMQPEPPLPPPPPLTPPPPPQPITPTLEAKPIAAATAVAATAAVVESATIEGPLPPPPPLAPPLAPALASEVQTTVSATAAEVGESADASAAEAVDVAQTAVTDAVEESKAVASDAVASITDAPAPEV